MPALPLDEAGKYVAAAYLVFLALILIYVAIMAGRLSRIEKDLQEVTELLERRTEDEREPAASGGGCASWGHRTGRRRGRPASGWRCSTGRSSRSCAS